MLYLVKTPWWIKKWIYPDYLWSMPQDQKKIYLSFDDGPHPEATVFVLDILKEYHAAATFFCIGKNVAAHPDLYRRILLEGHAVGNHTHTHLNGWKTDNKTYFDDIVQASQYIDSRLFRPPYGKISRFQASQAKEKLGLKVVMWSVICGDFDPAITPQKCWRNIEQSAGNGSIIVYHDSEKAMERMKYALQQTLEHFSKERYSFEKLPAK